MNKNNTFEVTYTWPESGKMEVRYRAAKGSMEESRLMGQLTNIFDKAGGKSKSPYDYRYTDYKL